MGGGVIVHEVCVGGGVSVRCVWGVELLCMRCVGGGVSVR